MLKGNVQPILLEMLKSKIFRLSCLFLVHSQQDNCLIQQLLLYLLIQEMDKSEYSGRGWFTLPLVTRIFMSMQGGHSDSWVLLTSQKDLNEQWICNLIKPEMCVVQWSWITLDPWRESRNNLVIRLWTEMVDFSLPGLSISSCKLLWTLMTGICIGLVVYFEGRIKFCCVSLTAQGKISKCLTLSPMLHHQDQGTVAEVKNEQKKRTAQTVSFVEMHIYGLRPQPCLSKLI